MLLPDRNDDASARGTVLLPVARSTDLLVTDADGETLVYDLVTHEAHALDAAAALVWRHCDGTHTVSGLAALLRDEGGITAADAELVMYTLDRLDKSRLLEGTLRETPGFARVSRRALLRRAAAAGVIMTGVPTILSVVTPSTAYALTSCKDRPCNTDFDCCAGSRCVGNGGNPRGFCQ